MTEHNFQPRRQKTDCSSGQFPALNWQMLCLNGNGEIMLIWEEGNYDHEIKQSYIEEPCLVGKPEAIAKYDLSLFDFFWVLDTVKKDKHGNLVLSGEMQSERWISEGEHIGRINAKRSILKRPYFDFDFCLYINQLDE